MRSLGAALKVLHGLQRSGIAEATVVRDAAAASTQLLSQSRGLSTGATTLAPAAAVASGDVEGVLKEIDRVISSDAADAKEVSDAAVALAYLQAKGNRRSWGKVFEKASTSTFDAPSLTSFLWAATTAGVGHFKTVAELSGAAAKLLPSLNPSQLSIVVEALGKAGAKDEQLLANIANQVVGSINSYKAADLARLVWGFAAAGSSDVKLVKAASQALAGKAGELTGREAAQAIWGLARLRRADKATLDALVKAAKGKLDSGVDAAGMAWALGFIGYKADADTLKTLAAALKTHSGDLTPAHAVDAAWGLGVLGGDKAAATSLFAAASAAIEAAPDSLDPYQLASLYEAAAAAGAPLSEQVSSYAAKMHALVEEGAKGKRSAGLAAFKDDLAQATARAMGARYRPEVAEKVKSFAVTTPAGVHIDIVVDVDPKTKIAIEAVGPHYLSSAGTPLGPALSRAKLIESQGYKVVLVPFNEWAALQTPADKAKALLTKVKASVPAAAGKVDALQKKLAEPFDPYAQ